MKTDALQVYVSCRDVPQARAIARALLQQRLIACAQIVPRIESMYRWNDRVCNDSEALLLLKTRRAVYAALEKRVRELHSYTTPEIIACEVRCGNQDYLDWIYEETEDD